MSSGAPWPVLLLADLSILFGLVTLSVALVGVWRFPDLLTRLHAAAKISSVGLVAVLLGSIATCDAAMILRSLLIAMFLLFTAPVATYAMAQTTGEPEEAERERDGHS